MLDGKAYKEHFPDDPAYELPPGVPRQLNSAADQFAEQRLRARRGIASVARLPAPGHQIVRQVIAALSINPGIDAMGQNRT